MRSAYTSGSPAVSPTWTFALIINEEVHQVGRHNERSGYL